MIKIDINCTQIPKEKLKDGKYLKAVLFDNRNGQDEHGNDGFIAMDVTQEERKAGTRGKIIGNWRHLSASRPAPQQPQGGQADADIAF